MKIVALTCHAGYDFTPYADALRECGMEPKVVTPERAIESLAGVNGLLLTGGTDLNPALYGQLPHPKTQDPRPDRDALEQRLLREALSSDLPVLAICRGMQLFNVTDHGGTLHQDIEGHVHRPDDKAEPAHGITVIAGTKLEQILGAGTHEVNARHHQAVDRVGDGLVTSAYADDGVIEAVERPDLRFAIAVQWHPENQIHRFAAQKNLFLAFAAAL